MKNKKIITFSLVIYAMIAICLVVVIVKTIKTGKNSDKDTTEISSDTVENATVEVMEVEPDDALTNLRKALESDDIDERKELLEKSADQGNTDAMYFIGEMYFQGIGVDTDYQIAARYLSKACELGNKKAFSIYAKMLFMGDGTDIDYDESASYFYSLTDTDGEACYVYAVMANLGLGMPRNLNSANVYIAKAASLGYSQAASYVDMIVDVGQSPTYIFDYYPPAKKVTRLDYGVDNSDLTEMIDSYYDELSQSEQYSAFYDELENLKQVNVLAVSTLAYFGNDGYIFLLDETDGTSLHDYMSDEYYTDDELKSIADNLLKIKKEIESTGSKFVLVLIPNKEIVYSESVPAYINRVNDKTKLDLLVEYLEKTTDLDIVYTKNTLIANKEDYQLYYKTDTHANMVGTLFILSDLMENLYGKKIEVNIDDFAVHMDTYLGDMGGMVNATERYSGDTVYYFPEESAKDEDKTDDSILLVGDSFSEFMNMESQYYFRGGVDYRPITEYGFDYKTATNAGLAGNTPDYVVWELVERYADRLK